MALPICLRIFPSGKQRPLRETRCYWYFGRSSRCDRSALAVIKKLARATTGTGGPTALAVGFGPNDAATAGIRIKCGYAGLEATPGHMFPVRVGAAENRGELVRSGNEQSTQHPVPKRDPGVPNSMACFDGQWCSRADALCGVDSSPLSCSIQPRPRGSARRAR